MLLRPIFLSLKNKYKFLSVFFSLFFFFFFKVGKNILYNYESKILAVEKSFNYIFIKSDRLEPFSSSNWETTHK